MSFITPRLPDNAPFSPAQRAWLDGFLAGLFAEATPSPFLAPLPPPEPEAFPWHDPSLSLDDRLALARTESRERQLMAAMAQLDCGQCGYLCQTYAEAIAAGTETSLTRCIPGGKATSRALKELLAAPAAPPVHAAPAMPTTPVRSTLSRDGAAAHLVVARPLNGPGSEKDTRHVVLAIDGSGLDYEVGDSLAVQAHNDPALVGAIIERLAAKPDSPVSSPDGIERPLREALAEYCEIRRPSDQAIEVLSSRARDIDESRLLQAMAEGYPGAGPDDADLLDLLETFPSARPPLSELVSALDPLQPRLYSIASSPKHTTAEVHLTVAAVRYEKRGRRRHGVASTFLADRLTPGAVVEADVRPSDNFRLAPSDRSIVMIGPGTGIAPFRAFLQERAATGASGRNWLLFGNPRRQADFLYEDELTAWHKDGLLSRLDTAFSRDQADKLYVQHRLFENAGELWAWLDNGAHLYVCGDAERMARDVDRGLAWIVAEQGRMEPAAAKSYIAKLASEGRYQRDVY